MTQNMQVSAPILFGQSRPPDNNSAKFHLNGVKSVGNRSDAAPTKTDMEKATAHASIRYEGTHLGDVGLQE